MNSLSRGEAEVFAVCIISGIFSGILFDSFKIIRRSFKKSAHFTDLCDGLFWTVYACFFIWWIFRINDGELRWFVFSGIILGASAYFVLLSRVVVIMGVFLLGLVKKILLMITEILLFPVRFVIKKARIAAVAVVVPLKKIKKKSKYVKRFASQRLNISRFCSKKL